MPLDTDRRFYVTASQAHRVMSGFKDELFGMKMEKPSFSSSEQIFEYIKTRGKKPLVRDLKDIGVKATENEIAECAKYYKCTAPVFSPGMKSVAREIAMSSFFRRRDEGFKSKDMERGNIQEGMAVKALEKKLGGVCFTNTGENQLFLTRGVLGVTPDAIQYADDFRIKSCGEVKNPKDTTHMKYLSLLKSQEDMLEVCPDYYWQAQCGLHVTEADIYHWASYHGEADYDESENSKFDYRMVYVPILPVQEHIDLLVIRAERVLKEVPNIIEDIIGRYGS